MKPQTNIRKTDSAIERLARYLRHHGQVRTARVSSAKARGAAKQYAYYGAARYMLTVAERDGLPINIPIEAARSDRRAYRLALADMDSLCYFERRIPCFAIGHLTEAEAAIALERLEGRK